MTIVDAFFDAFFQQAYFTICREQWSRFLTLLINLCKYKFDM